MSALALFGGAAMADDPGNGGDGDKVKIDPPITKPDPRSIIQPVIDCTLHVTGATGTLTFDIGADIGSASIVVTNLSTGESYSESCPSTPGSCVVCFTGDEGSYIIEIDTDAGLYYGEFAL